MRNYQLLTAANRLATAQTRGSKRALLGYGAGMTMAGLGGGHRRTRAVAPAAVQAVVARAAEATARAAASGEARRRGQRRRGRRRGRRRLRR